jgi:hypothetical protein
MYKNFTTHYFFYTDFYFYFNHPPKNYDLKDELLAELDDLVALEEPETFAHNNNIIEPTPSQSIFNIPQMPTVPTSSIRVDH